MFFHDCWHRNERFYTCFTQIERETFVENTLLPPKRTQTGAK